MNYITTNFDQILSYAQGYGSPLHKKRAILREFLQCKTLSLMYKDKTSASCHFIGGTSLRLLHGLDRFSEDMDFDLISLEPLVITELMENVVTGFRREGIGTVLYKNQTQNKIYYELRFPALLYDTGISPNKDEVLAIKFDYEPAMTGEMSNAVLLNRFGLLATVVSLPLEQILVQKMAAYLGRPQTQARDIYDLVWLLARGVRPDEKFAMANGLPKDLTEKVKRKFMLEQSQLAGFITLIRPFLIDETHADNLEHLPSLLR